MTMDFEKPLNLISKTNELIDQCKKHIILEKVIKRQRKLDQCTQDHKKLEKDYFYSRRDLINEWKNWKNEMGMDYMKYIYEKDPYLQRFYTAFGDYEDLIYILKVVLKKLKSTLTSFSVSKMDNWNEYYESPLFSHLLTCKEITNASSQACNLQPSNSLDADPVKSCLKESENYEATQPANQTCLEESGNTDATDLEPDSQTMKATDQDTSQPAVSGTMKVDYETTPTDSQQTGSLDNGVTDLKTAAKDKCEIFWCLDWGKNHNKGYKTFQDKVYNYTTWKFKEKRRATVDLLLIFLIMLGRWMRDGIHNHERWDTQSYKSHRYLQWSNDFKHETGHDKKLFGYLKFKFKTCQPFLGLILFR